MTESLEWRKTLEDATSASEVVRAALKGNNLANNLAEAGRLAEAIAIATASRAAVESTVSRMKAPQQQQYGSMRFSLAYNLASMLREAEGMDAAEAMYQAAVELGTGESDRVLARAGLGSLLIHLERWNDAIVVLMRAEGDAASARAPGETMADILADQGVAWSAMRQNARAVEVLKRAVDVGPTNTRAAYNLAVALREMRCNEEAIAALRRVLALDERHADANVLMARALVESGRLREAIGCMVRALGQRLADPDIIMGTILLLRQLDASADERIASVLRQAETSSGDAMHAADKCLASAILARRPPPERVAEIARGPGWSKWSVAYARHARLAGWQGICHKGRLYELIRELPFAPRTVTVVGGLRTLTDEQRTFLSTYPDGSPCKLWFVKDPELNRGLGVSLTDSLDATAAEKESAASTGGVLVQQSVGRPMLIGDRRKFELRYYVVVTEQQALVYDEPLLSSVGRPFDADSTDLGVHTTNPHQLGEVEGKETRIEGLASNIWADGMARHGVTARAQGIIATVLSACRQRDGGALRDERADGATSRSFLSLAFDFIVDETGQLFLIEVNASPEIYPGAHPPATDDALIRPMVNSMWISLLDAEQRDAALKTCKVPWTVFPFGNELAGRSPNAERHGRLKELLVQFHDVASAAGIRYWLDFGTLLGVVRDGDLIAWDDDVDVSCREEDRAALPAALEQAGISWAPSRAEPRDSLIHIPEDGRCLDVYFWKPSADAARLVNGHRWNRGSDIAADSVAECDTIDVFARQLPIPARVHAFLTNRYGRDWRVPQPTWDASRREAHVAAVGSGPTPAAPSIASAEWADDGSLRVVWTADGGVERIELETAFALRPATATHPATSVEGADAAAGSAALAGRDSSHDHVVRLRAHNANGSSPWTEDLRVAKRT